MPETSKTTSNRDSKIELNDEQMDMLCRDIMLDMSEDLAKTRRNARLYAVSTCVLAMVAGVLVWQVSQGPTGAMAGESAPTPKVPEQTQGTPEPMVLSDPEALFELQPMPEPDGSLWQSSPMYEPTSTTSTNGYRPESHGSTGR